MQKALTVLVAVPAAALVLALGACSGGSAASTTPSTSAATPSGTPSSSPVAATGPFLPVDGYTYTTLPSELAPITSELQSTKLVSEVEGRGAVADGSTDVNVAVIVATYTPAIAAKLDATPVTKVLDGAVKGVTAFAGGKTTTADHVLSGTHARVISGTELTVALIYRKGQLFELLGPPGTDDVLDFATAYAAAIAA